MSPTVAMNTNQIQSSNHAKEQAARQPEQSVTCSAEQKCRTSLWPK